MFLRTSISSTKKFFQKTLGNFKSFLSGGYQKLPKSPPCNPFSCDGRPGINLSQSYRELEKVYSDFSNQLDGENEKVQKMSMKKLMTTKVTRHEDEVRDDLMKHAKVSPVTTNHQVQRKENRNEKRIVYEGKRRQKLSNSDVAMQGRTYFVAQKLKELEMMDKSNVEHILDIEEVLHYYSRLTCPEYRDIVDKFFMDMYAELCKVQASSFQNKLRPGLQTIKS